MRTKHHRSSFRQDTCFVKPKVVFCRAFGRCLGQVASPGVSTHADELRGVVDAGTAVVQRDRPRYGAHRLQVARQRSLRTTRAAGLPTAPSCGLFGDPKEQTIAGERSFKATVHGSPIEVPWRQ